MEKDSGPPMSFERDMGLNIRNPFYGKISSIRISFTKKNIVMSHIQLKNLGLNEDSEKLSSDALDFTVAFIGSLKTEMKKFPKTLIVSGKKIIYEKLEE